MKELVTKTNNLVRLAYLIRNGRIVFADIIDGFTDYFKVPFNGLSGPRVNSEAVKIISLCECSNILITLVNIIKKFFDLFIHR
jgi:hypothetical protein